MFPVVIAEEPVLEDDAKLDAAVDWPPAPVIGAKTLRQGLGRLLVILVPLPPLVLDAPDMRPLRMPLGRAHVVSVDLPGAGMAHRPVGDMRMHLHHDLAVMGDAPSTPPEAVREVHDLPLSVNARAKKKCAISGAL